MNTKRNQHVIPQCYQKSWLAPDCPKDFEPYVWLISKDGSKRKRKAPRNVFVERDKYTIHLTDGTRSLVVEDTLGAIEDAFVRVLPKIRSRQKLSSDDFAILCIFTAATIARTNAMGRRVSDFFGELHELVLKGERSHNAPPVTSLETADMAHYAHQRMIQTTLETLPQMLFRMSLAILETDDGLGFITSDTPCIWFDPDAHRRPPALRSPNLGNPRIEITLPVTPQQALLFTHSQLRVYVHLAPQKVDELNWRVRRGCAEYFISRTGETKPCWFDKGILPNDAWENTEEGRWVLERAQRYRRASEQWKREHQGNVKKVSDDTVTSSEVESNPGQ